MSKNNFLQFPECVLPHIETIGELKVISLIYTFYADPKGKKDCFMKLDAIADRLKCTKKTANTALHSLKKKGIITINRRSGLRSSIYTLNEEKLAEWQKEYDNSNPGEEEPPETKTEFEKILTADTNNKKRSFAPQSLDEVKAYWKEQCFKKSDPEDFYNNYQDTGWKRSWKDLAKKWEEREWDKEKPKEPTTTSSRGSERDTDYNQLVRNMGLINNFSM